MYLSLVRNIRNDNRLHVCIESFSHLLVKQLKQNEYTGINHYLSRLRAQEKRNYAYRCMSILL